MFLVNPYVFKVATAWDDPSRVAFFDADQQAEGDGVTVSSFLDRDGGGYDFNANVGDEPTMEVRAGDGLKELVFTSSTGDYMNMDSDHAALDFDPLNDDYTIVISFGSYTPTEDAGGGTMFSKATGSASFSQFSLIHNASGTNYTGVVGQSNVNLSNGSSYHPDAVWIFRNDANGHDIRVNNLELVTDDTTAASYFSTATWQLNGRNGSSDLVAGQMSVRRVAFYDSYLSNTKLGEIVAFENPPPSVWETGLSKTGESGATSSWSAASMGTTNSNNVVFSLDVYFEATPSDACIWEKGGSGIGSILCIRDTSTTATLRLRAGDGSTTSQDNDTAFLDITDFPKDDDWHVVVFDINPSGGEIRMWIDDEYKGSATTADASALDGSTWEGGGSGSFINGGTNINGEPTGAHTDPGGASVMRSYDNQLVDYP